MFSVVEKQPSFATPAMDTTVATVTAANHCRVFLTNVIVLGTTVIIH